MDWFDIDTDNLIIHVDFINFKKWFIASYVLTLTSPSMTIDDQITESYWEWNECLNIKICKCLVSI